MIPKVIHYCWFGGKPLPKLAIKCIESWKRYFPDYEIKEWNEDNFDINMIPYVKQAYRMKKYAFVSDYARFYILYHEGGIYFDTDVEVIRSFDDILKKGAFMGSESDSTNEIRKTINPGLGMASERKNDFCKCMLDIYKELNFVDKFGNIAYTTVVAYTTRVLEENGLKNTDEIQQVKGIAIYPKEYFNPFDNATGVLTQTANTHSIHWYNKSWIPWYKRYLSNITRIFHRFFGNDCFDWIKKRRI